MYKNFILYKMSWFEKRLKRPKVIKIVCDVMLTLYTLPGNIYAVILLDFYTL